MSRPQDGNGLKETEVEGDVMSDIAASMKEISERAPDAGDKDTTASALRGAPTDAPASDEPAADPAQPADGRARGPDGKFVKAQPGETPAAAPAAPAAQPDAAAQPGVEPASNQAAPAAADPSLDPQPPEHWSQLEKDRFGALPTAIKPLYLEKITSLEKGYQQKFERLAAAEKTHAGIEEVFAPLSGDLQQYRMTPLDAVKYLVATQQAMRRDPRGTLQKLANDYGIDLGNVAASPGAQAQAGSQPAAGDATGYLDPAAERDIAALKAQFGPVTQTVQQLTQAIQQQAQAEQRRQYEASVGAVQSFAAAKGPDGKPLHPYYADVREDMAKLWEKGIAKTLPEAYEFACQRNPEIKAALQRQAEVGWAAKREAERKADLARAKPGALAPAAAPASAPRDKAAPKRDSVKADLLDAWNEAQARA